MSNKVKIIVAHDEQLGIGKANKLPWTLHHDLNFFREVTTTVKSPLLTNAVIMGRKTWESIPIEHRPLPNRYNFVLSKSSKINLPASIFLCNDFKEALQLLSTLPIETTFCIGGAAIFKEALEIEICDAIYATEVQGDFHCDRFFPEYRQKFELLKQSIWQKEDSHICRFNLYVRKQSS